jgi:NAD(P)-dependent dehydrogenase (short-subunit alcohol dehydrogenase family)
MMSKVEKVALVTGAGSGIGRAISLRLLEDGFAVVLVGRRRTALDETAALGPAAARTTILAADITKTEEVDALFEKVRQEHGRLDVLFNNAGVFTPSASIEDLSLENWQAAVDVNLTGAFLCTRAAFRLMKDQMPRGGRIINNGSISAHVPRPHSASYTATKHAITGLTKATSLDGRKYNIACGQIDIGNASTDMTDKMERGILQANGSTAIEPTFETRYVADAVSYMAGLPLHANVQFMTVMATNMPFIGRG